MKRFYMLAINAIVPILPLTFPNADGLKCETMISTAQLFVGSPLIVSLTYKNAGESDRTIVVPSDDASGPIVWGVQKSRLSLTVGDKVVTRNEGVYIEGWDDTTVQKRLLQNQNATFTIDLRSFFKFPFDESGDYTLELEANGVKAEPLKFTIKKRKNVILARTIATPKEKDWEVIVEEQPMGKDDRQKTLFVIRQRFPSETYRDMILLKEKPIDLKVSDPNYHGRFIVWISEKGLHCIEPLKINFYRPGTKLPAEEYFTWERQDLASIEKIVCTESKEKRSTVDVTVTLKTKDGKSLDAVLRIETHKLRFLTLSETSR